MSNQVQPWQPRIGIIGGSGFSAGLAELSPAGAVEQEIATPYGVVKINVIPVAGGEIVYVPRHGFGHAVPPHRINHRAHIVALRSSGVKYVLSTSAVGSLRLNFRPGELVVLDDFIDLRGGPPATFFEGDDGVVRHTDFTEPFSCELRALLLEEAETIGSAQMVHAAGVYLCLSGPRYETPAEVRLFASWGADVVGMTVAPEAELAREAGLSYSSVAVVTNLGAGLSQKLLSHQEVEGQMAASRPALIGLLHRTAVRVLAKHPTDAG